MQGFSIRNWSRTRKPTFYAVPCRWECRYEGQNIPEGRERHFLFYRWLYREGRRLTEWPDDLVHLANREELPAHAVPVLKP